jgi:leucine dehydrogenase
MSVFTHEEFDRHEQVSFFHDEETGLRAIIAVHDTRLGPALGGCRMWAYESDEQALRDVLRLSRGMTYKAAITGLPLGGGKSVIIGDARKVKTPAMMRAMGRAVESFHGRYIVAEDVGTTVDDLNQMHKETGYAVGVAHDGQGTGDPSPTTAYGVYMGLKAAVKYRLGKESVAGLTIAVQGLGNVGYNLCKLLAKDGARLLVTDVQTDRIDTAVKELQATAVALNEIYGVEADVFSPCALGAILNDDTIPRLKARVVAGAANNQLAEARHGDALRDAEVLYVPDYLINAGGLIHVYYEYLSRTSGALTPRAEVLAQVEKIAATAESIFNRADKDSVSTALAADRIAEQRFRTDPDGSGLHISACG